MPLPGRIGFAVKLVEVAPLPDGAFAYLEVLAVAVDRQGIRCVGLQFDRIGSGGGSAGEK